MDQSKFLPAGKKKLHNRAYRFASSIHKDDGNHPSWILFGDDASSNLILSQPARSAEISLLRIVNYIHNIYTDYLHFHMETSTCTEIVEKWGLPEHPEGFYDSLMTMVSNPADSNYGEHDDGKPGLCSFDTFEDGEMKPNKYSKFNLVVPTVVIQNHTKKTTSVLF